MKIDLSNANRPLFDRIKYYLQTYPEAVDMGESQLNVSTCNTVACIAGLTCVLARTGTELLANECSRQIWNQGGSIPDSITWHCIEKTAMRLLGIEDDHLFYTDMWPLYLRNQIRDLAPGSPEYTAVVIKAIDQFLTGDFEYYTTV